MIDIIHPKCKTQLCYVRANGKYDGYCFRCYIYTFPDNKIARNYKTKEKTVVDFVKEKFSGLSWIEDKKIYDGCSNRRPDLFLDLGYQVIIIEIDENCHNNYNCENKRLMEISTDIDHRPLIVIRFNPDKYNDIKSCWKTNKKGLVVINDKIEWNNRLSNLKKCIKKWLKNESTKTIEIEYLFFNDFVLV